MCPIPEGKNTKKYEEEKKGVRAKKNIYGRGALAGDPCPVTELVTYYDMYAEIGQPLARGRTSIVGRGSEVVA